MAPDDDRVRRPWLLGALLVLLTAGIALALLASEPSGTGAENVGDDGTQVLRDVADPAAVGAAPGASAAAGTEATATPRPKPRNCRPTRSNPGGTNNYIPDAPFLDSLGSGFVITGRVRSAKGCAPLENVRIQVWLATETGGEQDNRASVRTNAKGIYRIETAPTVAQFGEPNIHVGYDDGEYREVFIRRVVDLDDKRAVVDLTLAKR